MYTHTIPRERSFWSAFRALAAVSVLGLAGLVPITSAVFAGETAREVTHDGVLHVLNPPIPVETPATLEPAELWRIGGDDEDVVFGVLDDITTDADGNIYMLDIQLTEVLVFDEGGEYQRSIGREGGGPGEFRRPGGMFTTHAGQIAVVQAMPGRIVLLTPAGEPSGNFPVPAEDDGVQFFNGAERSGDQIAVALRRFAKHKDGVDITISLIRVDAGGKQTAKYMEHHISREFTTSEMDEKSILGSPVWSVTDDGTVFINNSFDAYHIQVWHPEGVIDRVIERSYDHRIRSAGEIERRTSLITMGRGRGHGRRGKPAPEIKASKTDRDIVEIYPRRDGTVWVLNSRGAYDAGPGSIATFDIFDRSGVFVSQITLLGDGNYDKDEFHIVGDRLYVVTGVRSARAAMKGASSETYDEDADARLPEVICYDLGHATEEI